MESYLIKDTTREEREQIVKDSLGITSGNCDGCMAGLADMCCCSHELSPV